MATRLEELLRALVERLEERPEQPERRERDIVPTVNEFARRVDRFHQSIAPRVRLSDGNLGFRVAATSTVTVVGGPNPADPNAPRETLTFTTRESQIRLNEPMMTLDGAMSVDLEILSFSMEGVSKVLFGRETKVRMMAGYQMDQKMRATRGRVVIPPNLELGQVPIRSVQKVFVTIETPLGILHNREPARMEAFVTRIPPVGAEYVQQGVVPLFDEAGKLSAAKVAQTTRITEILA